MIMVIISVFPADIKWIKSQAPSYWKSIAVNEYTVNHFKHYLQSAFELKITLNLDWVYF